MRRRRHGVVGWYRLAARVLPCAAPPTPANADRHAAFGRVPASAAPSARAPLGTPPSMDLDAYCRRIGLDGPLAPDQATLDRVVFHHATSVPFENLDVLAGLGIRLDPEAIEEKIVHRRRGGYCFEQNALLMGALEAIGFQVTPMAARVRLQQPRSFTPPRTHMCLRVDIDGVPWLADVGIGGLTPSAPLRLDTDRPQATRHETHRIVDEDGLRLHQARSDPDAPWKDVYDITGESMPRVDREIANWWTSTNPTSKFRQNLLLALVRRDGTRIGMQNHVLTHRRGDVVLATREIVERAALGEALHREFGLRLDADARLDATNLRWQA